MGDRQYGIIWRMSQDIYSDGDPLDPSVIVENFMERACLLPFLPTQQQSNAMIPGIELLCETGVGDGTGSGPGDDPTIEMYISEDSGRTWRDPVTERLGKQGEYRTRVMWQRNGAAPMQPAIKIVCTAPVKRVWSGLSLGKVM